MTDFGQFTSRAAQALVGTCGISVIVKLIDGYFRYREKAADTTHVFREELHARVNELVTQLRAAQAELDQWKQRYWSLYQGTALLRARHRALCLRFEDATGSPPPADEGEDDSIAPSSPGLPPA